MDKAENSFVTADDKVVTAATVFSPNKPNGTIEMQFTFDASALAVRSIVVFETLFEDGIEIAKHTDINDEGQTIKIVKREIVNTGDDFPYTIVIISAVSAIVLLGIGTYLLIHRRKKSTKK